MSARPPLDDWPEVSTFENPRNLPAGKVLALKGFWTKLLSLFHTEDPLLVEFTRLFRSVDDAPESVEVVQALKDLTPETFRDEFYRLLRHDYADLLPMRFLRARSYAQDQAMRMLLVALAYRRKAIPRAMMSEAQSDAAFIEAIKKGKSFVPCYDNQGRTITYIKIKNHARGDCSQDVFERYTLYAMEHAHLLHHPFQDRTVLLVDMSGFSVTSLDLGAIKFLIQNFEQYYPEELHEGVIHNAPWLFGTAWSIIKPLLRQQTREKITFTSNLNELAAKIGTIQAEKVVSAQLEYIPKSAEEPSFRDESRDLASASAACQEAFRIWNQNITEFEAITQEWAHSGATGDDCSARRSEKCWQLSGSYWLIDQYIRPRSYLDRQNLLPPSRESALNLNRSKTEPVRGRGGTSLKSQLSSMSINDKR